MVWASTAAPSLEAQAAVPTEYEVKAAYLYNFGKFVRWPAKRGAAESGTFAICVLGEDPFGPALDSTVAGETLDGKNVLARRISKVEESANCRILFISSSEDKQLKSILETLDRANVLTVSDIPQFARRGGMVGFVLEAGRVRFQVNLASTEGAGLSLSSQLLKLAISVIRSPQAGE